MNDNDGLDKQKTPYEENVESESIPGSTRLASLDLVSGIAVFCFGLFVFLSGIHMCFFAVTGTKVWYYSPGFFPCFVGLILMLTALVMSVKKLRIGGRLSKTAFSAGEKQGRQETLRLVLAIGLFAIYVFVLIGLVPFVLATFAFLAVTMILFRTDKYPIWKLMLISAAATGAVYLVFGVIASVPLP